LSVECCGFRVESLRFKVVDIYRVCIAHVADGAGEDRGVSKVFCTDRGFELGLLGGFEHGVRGLGLMLKSLGSRVQGPGL